MKTKAIYMIKNPFLTIRYQSFDKINDFCVCFLNQFYQNYLYFEKDLSLFSSIEARIAKHRDLYFLLEKSKTEQKQATQLMQEQFRVLSAYKIKRWDILIQAQYLAGTPEHQELLGKYRKPFQSGSYASRLQAVEVLHHALKDYPNLFMIKEDVHAFLLELRKSFCLKKQAVQRKKINEILYKKAQSELIALFHQLYQSIFYKNANAKAWIAKLFDFQIFKNNSNEIAEIKDESTANQAASQKQNIVKINSIHRIYVSNYTKPIPSQQLIWQLSFFMTQYFDLQNQNIFQTIKGKQYKVKNHFKNSYQKEFFFSDG